MASIFQWVFYVTRPFRCLGL